jgi:hypothetical protein
LGTPENSKDQLYTVDPAPEQWHGIDVGCIDKDGDSCERGLLYLCGQILSEQFLYVYFSLQSNLYDDLQLAVLFIVGMCVWGSSEMCTCIFCFF